MKPKKCGCNKEKLSMKKAINLNERERSMFDDAVELGVHNVKYFLPNKTMDDRSNQDVRV